MTTKANITFLFLTLIFFIGCKSGTTVRPVTPVDVYIVGQLSSDNSNNGVFKATYWKNGTPVTLSTVPGSLASAIAVQNGNVYIAGEISAANGNTVAVCWKNSAATRLADSSSSSYANGIAALGNDIYIAGVVSTNHYQRPVYWKNGTEIALPLTGTETGGSATAITISGPDILIAGNTNDANGEIAVYWKNGVEVRLTDPTKIWATASAIAVQGNNVYVGGAILGASINTGVLWKNGIATNLPNGGYFRVAVTDVRAIGVNKSDVYVAGTNGIIPGNSNTPQLFSLIYWKNGSLAYSAADNATGSFDVTGIALNGDDVYITGLVNNTPCYWKNGTAVMLSTVFGSAQGIVIVPR